MILYVYHNGDSSVGINGESFSIVVPQIDADDFENLEFFKKKILQAYRDFFDFKLIAQYDFEAKAESEAEAAAESVDAAKIAEHIRTENVFESHTSDYMVE